MPITTIAHGESHTFDTSQHMIMAIAQGGAGATGQVDVSPEGGGIAVVFEVRGEMGTMDDCKITREQLGDQKLAAVRNIGAHAVELQYS